MRLPGEVRSAVRRQVGLALALFALLPLLPGCTRSFYRRSADEEVSHVLAEKDQDPAWKFNDYYVYPDRLARFADPTRPDRPPTPPDDPGAWSLAPRPQCPKEIAHVEGTGYLDLLASWDAANRARRKDEPKPGSPAIAGLPSGEPPAAEAPAAKAPGPTEPGPDGCARAAWPAVPREPFLINLEQSVELASFNSREFQDQRENLYEMALPVTLERFAFAAQFEALNTSIRQWAGRESSVGEQNNWSSNSTFGVSKLFATGARLMAQVANQTVINFTGTGPRTFSQSTLTLDFIQPLLRGGGRAVTLEPLTQAERTLLYAVRDFARFHKLFFVSVAAGSTLPVVSINSPTTSVSTSTAGPVGYYPTLLLLMELRNARQNERSYAQFVRYFQALAGGGSISRLQVDQVQLAYLSARSTVLQLEESYGDAVDLFKLQLGVPTAVPLSLDDSPLEPLTAQMRNYEGVDVAFTATLTRVNALAKVPPANLRADLRRLLESADLLKDLPLRDEALSRWDRWRGVKDIEQRLTDLRRERADLQVKVAALESEQKPVPAELSDRLRLATIDLDVGLLEFMVRAYEAAPDRPELFQRVIDRVAVVLAQARTEQTALLGERWPKLPPVCLNGVNLLGLAEKDEMEAQLAAGRAALLNRLDLMNERARLVDAWRKIAVAANALLGTFNVEYNLQSITPPDEARPFAFAGARTQHQLILNTELPLARKLERNNYRSTLLA
ncbi:MAG TPA: hypothetical protein VFW33_14440, partial [Gemmataceae bacterium]|nr:hypothetical protein [Gemmataceae bacterium]